MRYRHIAMAAMLMAAAAGMKAQDCAVIMLPYFGGDAERMAAYPEEKLEWRCRYARAAFYESDSVPAGAEVLSIAEVKEVESGVSLPADYRVDLTTMSYYAYTFMEIQQRYRECNRIFCFETPGSAHRYLVLRSIDEMMARAEEPERYDND